MHPKPIDELVQDDLLRHSIWEYATEGEFDETYVQPFPGEAVPAGADDGQIYHVACDLRTARGKELLGFMSLCQAALHDVVPAMVGTRPVQDFSFECPPRRRDQAAFEAFVGSPFDALFPVQWKLRVLVEGESTFRSGSYAGPG